MCLFVQKSRILDVSSFGVNGLKRRAPAERIVLRIDVGIEIPGHEQDLRLRVKEGPGRKGFPPIFGITTSVSSRWMSLLRENSREPLPLRATRTLYPASSRVSHKGQNRFLVFHNQNRLLSGGASNQFGRFLGWFRLTPGKPDRECVPFPGSLSTWISPPLWRRMPYTVASPSPTPSPLPWW